MVVQADVERHFRHAAPLQQGGVAVTGVLLDLGEFLVGQLARFVEDGVRNPRLAEVVQQTGQAGLPRLLFVEPSWRASAIIRAQTATECM